jgi:gluconolactonase
VIAERWQGKRLNSPNDIVVRSDGYVYRRELDSYGEYRVTATGAMELIASYRTRPNGIALSPDGKLLYVAKQRGAQRAWDLDPAGKAENERVLIPRLPGGLDGMKVDVRGNLYTPRQSSTSAPSKCQGGAARNRAFGDKDLRTLYITGRTARLRVRMPVEGALQYQAGGSLPDS